MLKLVIAFALASAPGALFAQQSGLQHAQSGLQHAQSGISVPARIGVMTQGDSRDLSNGGALDVMTQYGSDLEPVTLYIYRGAYPNAALWFERTRAAMKINVGQFEDGVEPRSFVLAGAPTPNGLREEYTLPRGGRWSATAVAIAQVGEWTVKARITSATLDQAGVAAKMDGLLAAMRFARPAAAVHSMIAPAPCDTEVKQTGKLIARADERDTASALVQAIVPYTHARGMRGLAAEPAKWCRARTNLPAEHVTVYRERNGKAWVALVGDAGRSVAAHRLEMPAGQAKAAVYGSDVGATRLAALYEDLPDPEKAVLQALPVATGAAGLGSFSTSTEDKGGGSPVPVAK